MGFGSWANGRVARLTWVDIPLIKLSVAAFVLMLAKLWEPLLSLDWYWYALGGTLMGIGPTYISLFR
jgi:hypothetical protein